MLNTTTAQMTTTPRYPNCARDWIIWGSPSCGPCAEWNAVNTVPTAAPVTMATSEVRNEAPSAAPTIPVASVVRFALDMNHSGNSVDGFPRRSVRGIQSMDFDSIAGESDTDIIMLTHLALEKNINAAIAGIQKLPLVVGKVTRIRLEQLNSK